MFNGFNGFLFKIKTKSHTNVELRFVQKKKKKFTLNNTYIWKTLLIREQIRQPLPKTKTNTKIQFYRKRRNPV